MKTMTNNLKFNCWFCHNKYKDGADAWVCDSADNLWSHMKNDCEYINLSEDNKKDVAGLLIGTSNFINSN